MKSTAPLQVSHRILLVDDNKLGLAARKSVLEELGHTIITAKEGAEALESFQREPFDLVITDYRMPQLSGTELIKGIRAVNSSVPIILISGYVEALGLTEDSTGADFVIPKSANEITHLVRTVNRVLRGTSKKTPKKPVSAEGPHGRPNRSRLY